MNTRNKTKSFYRISKVQLENIIKQVADGDCGAVGVFIEREGGDGSRGINAPQKHKNGEITKDIPTTKCKPAKEQMLFMLKKIECDMRYCSDMLEEYGMEDHADELRGDSLIVQTWIEGIKRIVEHDKQSDNQYLDNKFRESMKDVMKFIKENKISYPKKEK